MGVHTRCPLTTLCQIAAGLFWRARVAGGIEPPTPRGTWAGDPAQALTLHTRHRLGYPGKPLHTLPPARFYAAPRLQQPHPHTAPTHAAPKARPHTCPRASHAGHLMHPHCRPGFHRAALRLRGFVALATLAPNICLARVGSSRAKR